MVVRNGVFDSVGDAWQADGGKGITRDLSQRRPLLSDKLLKDRGAGILSGGLVRHLADNTTLTEIIDKFMAHSWIRESISPCQPITSPSPTLSTPSSDHR